MIERQATEHLPKTSELVDLADMASGLVAFISNRKTRFESDRGAATLLLLCVNWCPVTIYLHAVRRQLQYLHVFDRQFLMMAAHIFARCHAAAARCIKSALTSNKQKPVVTTLNTVRIIKYFSAPKRIPRRK